MKINANHSLSEAEITSFTEQMSNKIITTLNKACNYSEPSFGKKEIQAILKLEKEYNQLKLEELKKITRDTIAVLLNYAFHATELEEVSNIYSLLYLLAGKLCLNATQEQFENELSKFKANPDFRPFPQMV